MILYRVISNNNSNKTEFGINSFNYNSDDYIHFFILPENAEIFQIGKYTIKNQKSLILKCDISYNLLEFGVGLYSWYYHFKFVPFLEVRIKKKDFSTSFIMETSTYIKNEWKNTSIFKRYLINCIYNQNVFTYVNFKKNSIILNQNFNFLYYFNEFDLIKEQINIHDYPKDINFSNLKKQELSLIKRTLISLKENIEMFKDFDQNFYNLYYIDKHNCKKS